MATTKIGPDGGKATRGARVLTRTKTVAGTTVEETLRKVEHELRERVKELNCLYGISGLVETPGTSLQEILQGTADLIPPSWQYPEVTCGRIIVNGQEFRTANFRETAWGHVSSAWWMCLTP
ncbi:MAG: hypothetical protein WBF66_12605 [Dehalococcoidia bacterium]